MMQTRDVNVNKKKTQRHNTNWINNSHQSKKMKMLALLHNQNKRVKQNKTKKRKECVENCQEVNNKHCR
jgi:hypothetical protein